MSIDLFPQDIDSVLEFMQRDLGITTVNAFRFVSQLPIAGIDQALVRGKEGRECGVGINCDIRVLRNK